jgi:hypothetical protein
VVLERLVAAARVENRAAGLPHPGLYIGSEGGKVCVGGHRDDDLAGFEQCHGVVGVRVETVSLTGGMQRDVGVQREMAALFVVRTPGSGRPCR